MKVFIMRGLPGSGKSTWAKHRVIESGNATAFVSADSYHLETVDGKSVYNFKKENAKKAHDSCIREFLELLNSDLLEEIIVDNTNTTVWEIAPYYRLAEAYGCEVEIVQFRCSAETAFKRTIHNVPAETIARMALNLKEEKLPPWWKVTMIDTEPKPAPGMILYQFLAQECAAMPGAYSCNRSGDNSGVYVQKEVADDLLAMLKRQLSAIDNTSMSDMNYAGIAWAREARELVNRLEGKK